MSGEELSILNEGRKTLSGPEHLQDLIDWSRTSATAIEFWTASGDVCQISYTLLDDLTSALAERIVASLKATRAQTQDVIIPILISQSPELYISWIAILKAGAAFCPIAIDSPAERVNFILQDVSASLVITTASHEGWLAEIAPNILSLCVSLSSLESTCRRVPPPGAEQMTKAAPSPESLAYIMYTSG
jgi:non-ribosomal peptide synthetase component F